MKDISSIEEAIADGEAAVDRAMAKIDKAARIIALSFCIILASLCDKSVCGWICAAVAIFDGMILRRSSDEKDRLIKELEDKVKSLSKG